MRIVVPIKQVPETNSVRMDEETGTMVRDGVEAIVNPLDLYAIEAAVRLRESGAADEVLALSMGPPKAETALREAISMGCDGAALVSDARFAASDTWATSYVLATAVRKLGECGLVICGERATDGDTGQVGPGVAAFLDLPVVTYVSRIESVDESEAVVERLIEGGYERLAVELPAVLTVVKEIAVPRLPTLAGKRTSRSAQVRVYSAEELEVDLDGIGLRGSPTRVVKIFRPQVAGECEMLQADDDTGIASACDRFTSFLTEKGLG